MQGRSQKEFFSLFQEGFTKPESPNQKPSSPIKEESRGRAAVAVNKASLDTLLTLANLLVVAGGVKPHSTGEVTRLRVSSNGASKNKVAIALHRKARLEGKESISFPYTSNF
jgi:hypothetical protein